MTTNNPNDDAWTDSASQGEGQPRDVGESEGSQSGASFKVVTPSEGGSPAVTREEIERQTAEMAARDDTPSHIDYGALQSSSAHDDSAESTRDQADDAQDASHEPDRHEDHHQDHRQEDPSEHEDARLREQDQNADGGAHSVGAGGAADEVEGAHSPGFDSGVENDSNDHGHDHAGDAGAGEGREVGGQSHEAHESQGLRHEDDSAEDRDHEEQGHEDRGREDRGREDRGREDRGHEDHSLGDHVVDDDHQDHSLGSDDSRERDQGGSQDQTVIAEPRSQSSPPLYRESESADSDTSTAGYAGAAAAGGATAGYANRGQDSTRQPSSDQAATTSGSDHAATASAPPVAPVPAPAPDRAQQRAERDHALGKREKQEGAEEQAPVKPKPTTDKFFGSLGLFLMRVALAAVVGISGIQKVRNIEGVQAMLTSTALRDVVPENFMLLLAWALAIGELAIAAGLLFGFLTRIAGFGALLVGAGALILVQWLTNPISLEPGAGLPGSLELLIAVGGLLFLFLGAGRWSIDGAIRSSRAAKKAAQR